MAITQVNTASNTGQSTGPSISFGFTPTANNTLIAILCSGASAIVGSPLGWSSLGVSYPGTDSHAIYWKVSDGTETSATWAVNEDSYFGIILYEYSGLDTPDPSDQFGSAYFNGTVQVTPLAGGQNATAESLVVAAAFVWSDTETGISWSTNYVEDFDERDPTNNWLNHASATKITSALETSSCTITLTDPFGGREMSGVIGTFSGGGVAHTEVVTDAVGATDQVGQKELVRIRPDGLSGAGGWDTRPISGQSLWAYTSDVSDTTWVVPRGVGTDAHVSSETEFVGVTDSVPYSLTATGGLDARVPGPTNPVGADRGLITTTYATTQVLNDGGHHVFENTEFLAGIRLEHGPGGASDPTSISLRNCYIENPGWIGIECAWPDGYACTIDAQDCTFGQVSQSPAGYIAIEGGEGLNLQRCDFAAWADTLRPGSNALIESCWIHDSWELIGLEDHQDGIQLLGGEENVEVRFCRIEMYPVHPSSTVDPTSAILPKTDFGTIDNVYFHRNYVDGGAWTVYGGVDGGYGAPTNIRIEYNAFGRNGVFGPLTVDNPGTTTLEGNYYLDNGDPVTDAGEATIIPITTASDLPTAVSTAPAGAILELADGAYGTETLTAARTNWVTLRAVNQHGATFTDINIGASASYIRFEGLSLSGWFKSAAGSHHHIHILGCEGQGAQIHSVFGGSGPADWTIEYNDFGNGDGTENLIVVNGGDHTWPAVRNTIVRGNKIGPTGSSEDAIRCANYDGLLVEDNEFLGIIETGAHNDGLQSVWGGNDLTFRRNYMHDTNMQPFFIKDGYVTNVLVEDNLIIRNREAPAQSLFPQIWRSRYVVVRNNTIWPGGDFVLRNGAVDVQFPDGPLLDHEWDHNQLEGFQPYDDGNPSDRGLFFTNTAVLIEDYNQMGGGWTWVPTYMGAHSINSAVADFANETTNRTDDLASGDFRKASQITAGGETFSVGITWLLAGRTFGVDRYNELFT